MKSITVVAACIVLMAPQSAHAVNSVCNAYNPQTCIVAPKGDASRPGQRGPGQRGPVRQRRAGRSPVLSSTLPFTGLDIILIVLAGGTIICVGLLVRRLSRRSD